MVRDEIILHLPALRDFAQILTQDRASADDLVQDTMLRAWTRFDRFKRGTDLRAWLFAVQRNLFYSGIRRRRYETNDPGGAYAATLVQQPDHDARLDFADFAEAFKKLPAEQREALALVAASGFTHAEAADIVGVAPGTMKSRLNRARTRLVSLLGFEWELPRNRSGRTNGSSGTEDEPNDEEG